MTGSVEELKKRIKVAKGDIKADFVLKNGKVVNVFSGEIQALDVAVSDGIIAGLGPDYHGKDEVDITGKWVVPGFIDGHIHVESSMLTPSRLSAALIPHGTTTIISDPHEIANVMGLNGIQFMLEDSAAIPFDIFFMAPSCVPATHLETAGATLTASDLGKLKEEPRVLGLAEMMNFPGVLMGNDQVLEKIALFNDKIIDGHCPSLRGPDLQAYLATGIRSDHESFDRSEGIEKVQSGMMLMIREGTTAKNLEELLPLLNTYNSRRSCLVSDDLHAEDILKRGHLDFTAGKAVKLGLDPVTAVQLVTLNPAEYFGLRDRGAVSAGLKADLVVLDELERFKVASVYKEGRLVCDHGTLVNFSVEAKKASTGRTKPLKIATFTPDSFKIRHTGGKARIIEIIPGQIVTRMVYHSLKSDGHWVSTDTESDILKLCVVERHHATGNVGIGFVRGFGLKHGAIASSVAHDSHNVIVVGVSDEAIHKAVETVRDMGGGLAVVNDDGNVLGQMPLEIAGLMSAESLETVVRQLNALKKAAALMGCKVDEPFMALSFLALPVIPELKLSDKGLVDVNRFEIVSLFS